MKAIVLNLKTKKTSVKYFRMVNGVVCVRPNQPTTLKDKPKIGDEYESVFKSTVNKPTKYRIIG